MPPMKTKAPSFLAELFELTGNLKDLPYGDLAKAVMDAGWITALAETAVIPTAAGTVLVTFDVMVGKSYDALERLDSITMTMAGNPGPISVAARISARESVIFLLTGRLPPRPEAAAVPPPARGQMNGGDEYEVDMGDGEDDVYLEPEEKAAVKVVERREPDGLPIFRDLYEIGPSEADSTGEIVVAVLKEVRSFLGNASIEQVDALAVKNPDLVTFIKDLGTPADAAALRDAVMLRKAELSKGKVEPRRRTSALQRAN